MIIFPNDFNNDTFTTPVDIKSYTLSNPYIAPSAGYFRVSIKGEGYVESVVNGVDMLDVTSTTSASSGWIDNALFVRKGMSMCAVASSSVTEYAVYFIPFI